MVFRKSIINLFFMQYKKDEYCLRAMAWMDISVHGTKDERGGLSFDPARPVRNRVNARGVFQIVEVTREALRAARYRFASQ